MRMDGTPSISFLADAVAKAAKKGRMRPNQVIDLVMSHNGLTPNSHQTERSDILGELARRSAAARRRRRRILNAVHVQKPTPAAGLMSSIRDTDAVYDWMLHDGTGGCTDFGNHVNGGE